MAEHPAIVHQEAEHQHSLSSSRGRNHERQVEYIPKHVKDSEPAGGESQSDDPPAYERSGLELSDQTVRRKMELAEGLEPPTL